MNNLLSDEHVAAVGRRRRVVVNFDVLIFDPALDEDAEALANERLTYADDPAIQIDGIWWNWSEGNVVPYPSKHLPTLDHPGYQRWLDDGIDVVRVFLEQTHKRGLEAFFSHRMNGSDADPMVVPGVGRAHDGVVQEGAAAGQTAGVNKIPMKEQHQDWLFHTPNSGNGLWNFTVEGVREYALRNLREVAEDYDFDGIELDFARGIVFPEGEGWLSRHSMTTFMREMRSMLLEIEQKARPAVSPGRPGSPGPGRMPLRRSGRGDMGPRPARRYLRPGLPVVRCRHPGVQGDNRRHSDQALRGPGRPPLVGLLLHAADRGLPRGVLELVPAGRRRRADLQLGT